jgi:hypothetical protein
MSGHVGVEPLEIINSARVKLPEHREQEYCLVDRISEYLPDWEMMRCRGKRTLSGSGNIKRWQHACLQRGVSGSMTCVKGN